MCTNDCCFTGVCTHTSTLLQRVKVEQLRLVCTFLLNPATLTPKAKIVHPPFLLLHLSLSLPSLLSTSKRDSTLFPSSAPLALFQPFLIVLFPFHDAEWER
ncbi:hypothetical protein ATANTOWER_028180 [Ataeniobius toweri]|uniref:Uncharacterized protein n=1 Tax=Ataeniobius toweri TaxID=208326 RepID=A0ABU7ALQ4_9TELE|nr:hypothetical protein [Ataeniobius toweri]